MKKITAIIREDAQEGLVDALRDHGVPGASIANVKGYGEYVNTYSQDILETCVKVEIFTENEVAEKVVKLLMQLTSTGMEGDGIVAITPVDTLYRIRDQKEIE